MNKEKLQHTLITIQQKAVLDIKERISSSQSMVDIDETDTVDPEDLSHQSESAEMRNLFQVQLRKAEEDLGTLMNLDFSEKDTVAPGALVRTEKFNFLIGHTSVPFDFEGYHIVGVSVDSPIYPEMKGKRKGDSFSYSGNSYIIQEIL